MDNLIVLAKMVAAVVVGVTMALAALVGVLLSQYTDIIGLAVCVLGLYWLYKNRLQVWVFLTLTPHRLNRGWKPWLWHPLQRVYHKWRRKSYLTGGIMAKWHAGIVLAIIDDALLRACVDGKLSRKQYMDVMRVLGLLFGDERFVPRKVMHPDERRAYVRENIAAVKAGPKGSIPSPPLTEDKPKIVRLDYLRNRGKAA